MLALLRSTTQFGERWYTVTCAASLTTSGMTCAAVAPGSKSNVSVNLWRVQAHRRHTTTDNGYSLPSIFIFPVPSCRMHRFPCKRAEPRNVWISRGVQLPDSRDEKVGCYRVLWREFTILGARDSDPSLPFLLLFVPRCLLYVGVESNVLVEPPFLSYLLKV